MEKKDKKPEEGRTSDGKFSFGNKISLGRPKGNRITWQEHADRLAYWREQPLEVIERIVTDRVELMRLSSRDAEMVRAIYNSSIMNMGEERVRLDDREIGKPLTRAEMSGPNGGPIVVADEHRSAVRSRLVSPPADTDPGSETSGAE